MSKIRRILCSQLPRPGGDILLSEIEAKHVFRVLRLRTGDGIEAMDGCGNSAKARILTQGGRIYLQYVEGSSLPGTIGEGGRRQIFLEMSILKGPAMEWTVEKAVELGVHALIPVLSERTVIQIKAKGPAEFQKRWQRIADQALKQCGRPHRMNVDMPIPLGELIHRFPSTSEIPRVWTDTGLSQPTLMEWLAQSHLEDLKGLRILIGPEGGWSPVERKWMSGQTKVDLGPWVLRAETAALNSVSVVTAVSRLALDKGPLKKRI